MARLPALFTEMVRTSTLPIDDEAEALADLRTKDVRLVASRAVDLLGAGVGHMLVHLGVPRSEVHAPLDAAALRATPGAADVLAGARTVGRGETDRTLAATWQRALQAIAARNGAAPLELALPEFGADGDLGSEFERAILLFRHWRDLPATPLVDSAAGTALVSLLADTPTPDLFAGDALPAPQSQGVRAVVAIARGICAATADAPYAVRVDGRTYAYTATHFGTRAPEDGWLKAPGGVKYRIKPGYDQWKCNIFGGMTLALAELPVPTHKVGAAWHYPRAERFGPLLARKPGWEMVRALDHRDPADETAALVGPEQDAAIRALLVDTRPGDLLFVDHPGEPREGGGHTRVCVEGARDGDADTAPLFAQAREDAAREVRDGMARLGGGAELQFWLCRWTGA